MYTWTSIPDILFFNKTVTDAQLKYSELNLLKMYCLMFCHKTITTIKKMNTFITPKNFLLPLGNSLPFHCSNPLIR